MGALGKRVGRRSSENARPLVLGSGKVGILSCAVEDFREWIDNPRVPRRAYLDGKPWSRF